MTLHRLIVPVLLVATHAHAADTPHRAAPRPSVALETVIGRLRQETGVSITPLWNDIARTGIKPDTRVELGLKRAPAGRLLRAALDAVSAGKDAEDRLDYVIENGTVVIATRRYFADRTEARLYDAGDLERVPPQFTDAPSLALPPSFTNAK